MKTIKSLLSNSLTVFIRLLLTVIILPLVRLIWIREVAGLFNIPKEGGAVIAFNHQSYFDFIGFFAITPRPIYYIAAEKFYTRETHPMWKPIMKATGQIRVDRSSNNKEAVYEAVYEHLRRGDLVGIFPEGTRAPSNTEMLPAFIGVARFAHHAHVPVVPVGIQGAYEILSRHDTFPSFRKILKFNIGQPINPPLSGDEDALRTYTNDVMRHIEQLSNKPYPHGDNK